jgi:uncharacterized protein
MSKYFKNALYLLVLIGATATFASSYVDFFRSVNVDDASAVKTLLARGFDPNTPDESGQVALYVAVRTESNKVVATLIEHPGLKVDAVNAADETPLMMAALRGQLDNTQRLLARGAAINRPGWTPLHYAASGPEPKVVALLLDRGASVDAPSPNRTTALMMAARYGSEDSVRLLRARGADLKARNDLGLNAADFARLGGRDALFKELDAASR